jgi:putative endonuclease
LRATFAQDLPSVLCVTQARQKIGRDAEDLVAARLAAQGWTVLDRNPRSRYGELDIVALDGRALVFVEVKAGRQGSDFGPERPVHAIGPRKQRQVRRLAAAWISENRDTPFYREIRFDAIGVTYGRGSFVMDVEHIENAF